jgi:hypothetical protein
MAEAPVTDRPNTYSNASPWLKVPGSHADVLALGQKMTAAAGRCEGHILRRIWSFMRAAHECLAARGRPTVQAYRRAYLIQGEFKTRPDCRVVHAVLIAPGLWLSSPKDGNISNAGRRLSAISLPSCSNWEYRDGQPIHKNPQLAGISRIRWPTISR